MSLARIRVVTLVLRFKKYSLSLFLLPIVHLILLELFASALYIPYFLALFLIIYLLNRAGLFLSTKGFSILLLYSTGLYFITEFFEDSLYDLYIDMNMTFELSNLSYEVCCVLTATHIFILFLLGYNRAKLI